MKILGIILLVLGLAGGIYFGYEAATESETFNALGVDVAVSKANWTPVFISGGVFLLGLIILILNRK